PVLPGTRASWFRTSACQTPARIPGNRRTRPSPEIGLRKQNCTTCRRFPSRGAGAWCTKQTAWCLAAPEFFAPEWICRNPRARRRSEPAAPGRSFDVLHLLAQFFDLRFDFERETRDLQPGGAAARRFREQRIRLALHFLKQKIELFAGVGGAREQRLELLRVACQSREFLGDIGALRGDRGFLCQASGIERRFAQQIAQARFQSRREGGARAFGQWLDFR